MLEISVPTLLIDEEKVKRNINRMLAKARDHACTLRPHFKTHQSVEIGEWFRDKGVEKTTVSSFDMALKFASAGWNDITVAFPVNILEISKINTIASTIDLTLLVEDESTVGIIDQHLKREIGLMIKIDSGYRRTGVKWDDDTKITGIINKISRSKNMLFKGFLIHAGHSYKATGSSIEIRTGILQILDESLGRIATLRTRFIDHYKNAIISYGDTPTCSVGDNFTGIDELRPGNFVFYDLTQQSLGACDYNDIAVALACPVVAIHPERMEIVLYGGAVHFSKDSLIRGNQIIYGEVVRLSGRGWNTNVDAQLVSLSQEHGIARFNNKERFDEIKIGDILPVLPVHSCLTADCMGGYLSLKGEHLTV